MKEINTYVLLCALSIVLWGCPYSSPYGLSEEFTEPVSADLTGNWATLVENKMESITHPVKLIIAAKSDVEYTVTIYADKKLVQAFTGIKTDSITGSGFTTTVYEKKFLNCSFMSKVFIAEIIEKDGKLNLLPLSEHFTNKMIRSSNQLRLAIEYHYKSRVKPYYDEDFLLKNLVRVN